MPRQLESPFVNFRRRINDQRGSLLARQNRMTFRRIESVGRTAILIVVFGAWGTAVALGLWRLESFANTPGPDADAPLEWPQTTGFQHDSQLPTLVVFMHPQCDCSRASMQELAVLMARARGLVVTRVVFYRPSEAKAGWEQASLWRLASDIPGVTVVSDDDAHLAKAFGARVSGQSELYSVDGHLLFSGGITFARGHEGDNGGLSSILALVRGAASPNTRHTPVFGCLLREDDGITPKGA